MNKVVLKNKTNNKGIKSTIIFAFVLTICGIVFCLYCFIGHTNDDLKYIKVVSSNWSGWSNDNSSKKEESYCEIELHKKCIIKTRNLSTVEKEWQEEVFSFEITDIKNDSVSIHTFQSFSDYEHGIDLNSKKQDFVIKINEEIELITPTMDAGDIFKLSLSR